MIIANFKQNPSNRNEVLALAHAYADRLASFPDKKIGIAPSFVHLGDFVDVLSDVLSDSMQLGSLQLGVQDICAKSYDTGAYTGNVSAMQAKDMGARFAIIGHSERRTYCGESHSDILQKIDHAKRANLLPVLCVGESKQAYTQGDTFAVLQSQLNGVDLSGVVVAYEPVWAIGTGLVADNDTIMQVADFLRTQGATIVLYGGSVSDVNAHEVAKAGVDGALVGGASLHPDKFCAICDAF